MSKVLLLEIGAGALPAVTPVTAPQGAWMPTPYEAPPPPVPANLALLELVSAVRASWDAVNEPNVRYELERAPDVAGAPGAAVSVYRGTDRVYNSPESARTHWRVRSQVRGKSSAWSAWVAKEPVSPSSLLAGNGVNLLRDDYVSFTSLPPTASTSGAAGRVIDSANKIFDGALSTTFTNAGSNWTYIGLFPGDTYLKAGTYIVSSWVRSNAPSTTPRWVLRNGTTGITYNGTNFTTASTNTWTREASVVTVADDGWYALGLDTVDGLAHTILVDGLMLERQVGSVGTPSAFTRGIARPMVLSAIAAAAAAQDTADGKIETFIQPTMPVGASLGDLWFDSSNGNKQYRHNGTTFVVAQDTAIGTAILNAAGAQATADGKVKTWFLPSTSTPTASAVGDLWYQTDKLLFLRWNGSAWSVVASNVTNKNLIVNPTGMHDFDGWTGWIGAGRQRMRINKESFGFAFACDGANGTTAYDMGASQKIALQAGGGDYTLSANMHSFQLQAGGVAMIELRFNNASDVEIDSGVRPRITCDNTYNGTDRRYVVSIIGAPAGAAFVYVILRCTGTFKSGPGAYVRWWDIKLERSSSPTGYSDDSTPKLSPEDVYVDPVASSYGNFRLGLRYGGSGHRLGSQRNYLRSGTSAYGMVRTTTALSATSAGAVTVNAHTVRYGGYSCSYNAVSNAITGLTPGTTYVIYCVDADLSGGTRTYFAGTNPEQVMNINDDVYVVGQITIPTSGSSSGGSGGSGTNPNDWCVAADSLLPDGTLAGELPEGWLLPCYNNQPERPNIVHLRVQRNVCAEAECLRLVTESGASIVASTTTPMTLRDGSCVRLPGMLGHQALVYRRDGTFTWETVTGLVPVGIRQVAKISVSDQCYFAGERSGAYIATHNVQQMKP